MIELRKTGPGKPIQLISHTMPILTLMIVCLPWRPPHWHGTLTSAAYLTEDGVGPRLIQVNVGHEAHSSTAIYTHVSSDFMSTAIRKTLAPTLEDHKLARRKR
jgi:hypothetical protein